MVRIGNRGLALVVSYSWSLVMVVVSGRSVIVLFYGSLDSNTICCFLSTYCCLLLYNVFF